MAVRAALRLDCRMGLTTWQKAATLVRSSRWGKAIVGRLLCDPRSTEHRRSSGIASKKPLPPSIGQRLLYGLGIELDEDCPEVHERASGRMPSILDMLAQVLRQSLPFLFGEIYLHNSYVGSISPVPNRRGPRCDAGVSPQEFVGGRAT